MFDVQSSMFDVQVGAYGAVPRVDLPEALSYSSGMSKTSARTAVITAVLLASACPSLSAAVGMKTEAWPNTDDGFRAFEQRIEVTNPRNLLARRGATVAATETGNAESLADGAAGERGGEGRVFVSGQPSVITCYLGGVKEVWEVGLFTFNIDARANQDYEVRLADNSAKPGEKPAFPETPAFTTGDKVIGGNSGGFHSWFSVEGGGPLLPGKVDWVELRIWRTYNVKAGSPAKTKEPQGWTAAIELEILGSEEDVVLPSAEELARRSALRALPRQAPYVKKETWQETMVAAREALLEWESSLDRLLVQDGVVRFGPWHVAGPLARDDKAVGQLNASRGLDLEPKAGAPGPRWRACPEAEDGKLLDIGRLLNARPGEVVFLARTVAISTALDRRRPFTVGVGLARGELLLLPPRARLAFSEPDGAVVPNQKVWEWAHKPGEYQLLVRAEADAAGSCPLWLAPHISGGARSAGSVQTRLSRRQSLYGRVRRDFPDAASATQIGWEETDTIWLRYKRLQMAGKLWFLTDWCKGAPSFLVEQYGRAVTSRIGDLKEALRTAGEAARERIEPWLAGLEERQAPDSPAAARRQYYSVATVQEALAEAHRLESMRLAVEDQQSTFGERCPKAADHLAQIAVLHGRLEQVWPLALAGDDGALGQLMEVRTAADEAARTILLANPVLGFDALLLVRGGPGFASNWGGPNRLGNEIVSLSPVRPDGELTTVYKGGNVDAMDLSFDGRRILFSDGRHLQEVNVDGTGLRRVSGQEDRHVMHYDGCYLPNGRIMFVSTACEQAVPCTGQWYVGNMHVMDADGGNERRLTFDQDHSWNPCVLNNGRVIYTRWEYTDTPHYFSRLLFHMNPDGSGQMEYYGSNSYWPNAMYWPRPIPGHPSAIVCVVSGHHGVGRVGELLLLDPALGRHEADGVVQRIPGRGKTVEPVIEDGLVLDTWPRFATPYPLAEPGTHRGAGKYFLVTCKQRSWSPWGLYLVDVFDNMTPLLMGGYSNPIPLRSRERPPVIPPRVDLSRKDAVVYLVNVYEGGGLKGFPTGSVKALRVGSHHYRYGGNGDTRASSYEGGWDVKRILGTVPVHADGSALFRVPANTPVFVQPLDAEGKAVQTMRSWFTAMPGETLSCVGCHESQNSVPPSRLSLASRGKPDSITPWFGPPRGFSFDREVQPVLDRRCAGCHDGQPRKDGRSIPDLRAKRLHKDFKGAYSPAYLALHPHVRRAGYEADYHLPAPAEFGADTSPLVQLLKKGHHGVRLTREEWERLYTWIDFNIPYPANWRESHQPPQDEQVSRRAHYKKVYAGLDDRDEEPLPLPPVAEFVPPERPSGSVERTSLEGWPLTAEQTAHLQQETGLGELTLDLGDGVSMAFVPIPAGRAVLGDAGGFPDEARETVFAVDEPFFMGRSEVTNEQYARFDPGHDSAYMDGRFKDRFTRGYPVNAPDQPVIRISWHRAMAFCRWLSDKTGRNCTLPSEEQWEYACRAGTNTPWSFGVSPPAGERVANVADVSLRGWGWGRCEAGYSDGVMFSAPGGGCSLNAWGLGDMHGNVTEWTLSSYSPTQGRGPDVGDVLPLKVVRGGSWNDTFRYARSASRWRYPPHQPVYNVGFRVVCEPQDADRRLARAR